MKGGMFISILDIQILTGFSERTAQREHKRIREKLKKDNGRISIKDYADFYQIEEEEILKHLRDNR